MKAAFVFGWLMVVGTAMGSSPPPILELQPYEVNSPEGTFLFKVNPSSPDGAGPGDCTLVERESGKVVWERRMDHTFRQAVVDDAGRVAGIAYTKGPMDSYFPGKDEEAGEFVIEILDEKGAVRYSERARQTIGLRTFIGEPFADGVLFDEENGRMVVMMAGSRWRVYELWSAELIALFDPTPWNDDTGRYVVEAQWIPGTPLVLVHWYRDFWKDRMGGARFGIFDVEGKVIWELDRERRIDDEQDERGTFWKYRILSMEPEKGTRGKGPVDPFAPAPAGGGMEVRRATFELGLGEEGERVAFTVLRTASMWRVREVHRKAWVAPPGYKVPEQKPVPNDVPRLKAEYLDGFRLASPGGIRFEKLVDVCFGPNRIAAVPLGGSEVLVYDGKGKFLHICAPAEGEFRGETFRFGAQVSVNANGEVYLPLPLSGQALRFSATGERLEKTLLAGSSNRGLRWYFQPGTERVLADDFHHHGLRFSESKKQEAAAEQRIERGADGGWLTYVSDVAFAKNGSFVTSSYSMIGHPRDFMPVPPGVRSGAVLDVFDASGKPGRTIGIESFVSGSPSIAYDGKRIVFCDGGSSDVYLLGVDGKMLGAFPVDFGKGKLSLALAFGEGGEVVIVNRAGGAVKRYQLPAVK